MNKPWYLSDFVSALETIGVTCKDSQGNWKSTEIVLQEIAEKYDDIKDLIEEYFNSNKEN